MNKYLYVIGLFLAQLATTPLLGASWGTSIQISVNTNALIPLVGADSLGNVVSIWLESNGSNYLLRSATLSATSGTWSTPVTISTTGLEARDPQLAVDSSGNAIAVWRAVGVFSKINAATLTSGGSWSAPTILSTSAVNSFQPEVTSKGGAGQWTVVWTEFDGTHTTVHTATFS